MSGRTAQILAHLSHGASSSVLLLTVFVGVATWGGGALWKHMSLRANKPARRISAPIRVILYIPFMLSLMLQGLSCSHFGCAAMKAHSTTCISHIKQLAMGISMYAQDFDNHLPASAQWSETIEPRVREAARSDSYDHGDPFLCPAADSRASYGMNAALGGVSFSEMDAPASSVLLFDADAPIRSFAGGVQDFARTRHGGTPNVAFADGHAKSVNHYAQSQLIWTLVATGKPSQ